MESSGARTATIIYDPLGRFLQTDPIGYEDQYNLYAYVGNDPVNYNDPTGREKIRVSFKVGGLKDSDKYGHAYVEYESLETGEKNIIRGGPTCKKCVTKGKIISNSRSYNNDRTTNNLKVENGPADESLDDGFGEVSDSIDIDSDFGELSEKAERIENAINKAKVPYRPRGDNSNTVAGIAYEKLTGQKPENNSPYVLPGLDNEKEEDPYGAEFCKSCR